MNHPYTPSANSLLSIPLLRGRAVEAIPSKTEPAEIARLTRLLAAGDETAFGEFHKSYFVRLYQFLLVVTRGQEQQTDDALQETMLRVVRYARPFESEEAFWSWLKVLARSAARDAGRKQQRYTKVLESFALRLRLNRAELGRHEDALLGALEESLSELPELDRKLIEDRYVAGNTIKELSNIAGVTQRSMESRLFRLRQGLHQRLLSKLQSK